MTEEIEARLRRIEERLDRLEDGLLHQSARADEIKGWQLREDLRRSNLRSVKKPKP